MDRGFLLLTAAAGLLLVSSFTFAGVALVLRVRNDRRERRQERLRKRWEPAMLEVLGGAAAPEAIFDRVDDADGRDFLEFLLEYARFLRGEEQALIQRVAEPYLPLVIPELREGADESRGHAVLILARMGMPKYADVVAGALDDPSPVVSMIAARSLFRPGHEEHFPAVLDHLHRFTSWSRRFLAGMLARGSPEAAPLLRDLLADSDRPALVRAVACDALRELNALSAVPLAHEIVERAADPDRDRSPDRELLLGCLRILRQLGHDEHLPAVRAHVHSPDPVVRATAVGALAALGGHEDVPILQDRLDDSWFWVSLEAARGLMALGEVKILERLAASGGPWSLLARQVLSE